MALIARILMAANWGIFAFAVGAASILAVLGDHDPIKEIMEIQISGALPGWVVVVAIVIIAVGMALLGRGYWALHRILGLHKGAGFAELARRLRQLAQSLIGLWAAIVCVDGILPLMYRMTLPADTDLVADWFPLDLEIVLVIVGIALFAVAGALMRAAEVQDENDHFL